MSAERPDPGIARPGSAPPRARERWLAALAYLGPGFLLSLWVAPRSRFQRWHAAQGFVVFFAEALTLAGLVVLDATVGRIPWLGLLVMLLAELGALVGFVILSALGVVKSLAGEWVHLPLLERWARRVPVEGPESDPSPAGPSGA